MNALPRPAQAFVLLICLLGVAAASLSPLLAPPTEAGASWEIALFVALGLLAGRTKVRLMPRAAAEDLGSLSLSFALIFAALLRLGPGAAMLVGGFSTLASCLYPRRQPPHQIAFNLGLSAFATFATGLAFLALNGGLAPHALFPLFLAVMASSLLFFLLNTGAVATVIALCSGRPLLPLWFESFFWTAPSYLAAASAGTLATLLLGPQVGTVLLFVTPVAAVTLLAYTLSRRRAEENGRRIATLQTHEAELADALRREHLIAETLQRSLLSAPAEDAFPGLRVQTEYEPAWSEALIGGDFYDALSLGGNTVALVVGDVTGKGLEAATHTAEVKYALRAILREHPHPAHALGRLNDFLIAGQRASADHPPPLVAVALAVLDTRTGEVLIGAAGAEHPLLLRAGGEVEEVLEGGLLLGTLPDAPYEAAALRLGDGDCLLLVTDGVTEAHRGAEFFGTSGLSRAAREALAAPRSGPMGPAIIAEARAFAGGALHDDVCLLLARREAVSV